jgi:hypothetical protein
MSYREKLQNRLLPGMTRGQAVASATTASGAFIGFGDTVRSIQATTFAGRGGFALEYGEAPEPLFASDFANALDGFSDEDKALLAIDMFQVGVYDDINAMFDDNGELDNKYFVQQVSNAVSLAAAQAEMNLGTDFLDVLMKEGGQRSPEELMEVMQKAKDESKKGGRVISYIDPVGLASAAKQASSSVTGRRATPKEQRDFVKMIHGLQASGATSIDVGARAEAFAREQAPEEAKAMDYAGAAGVLMQVLGVRR